MFVMTEYDSVCHIKSALTRFIASINMHDRWIDARTIQSPWPWPISLKGPPGALLLSAPQRPRPDHVRPPPHACMVDARQQRSTSTAVASSTWPTSTPSLPRG